MDVRTTYLIMAVVFLAAPLGVYTTSRSHRDRELVLWCVGWILVGIGLLLVALRGLIPGFVSLILAHALFSLSYVFRTLSIKAELCTHPAEFRRTIGVHAGLAVLYFIVYTALVINNAHEHLRLMFVYGAHILMFGELFFIGLRVRREKKIDGALLVAAMGLLMGAGFVVRVMINILRPENIDLFTPSTDQIIFLMLLLVGFIAGNYGFAQIRLEKAWRKNQQIREELSSAQSINQKLERVLQEKNRLLRTISLTSAATNGGVMMSALAHEISQPLNSMRLNVDYLKRQFQDRNDRDPSAQALSDMLIDTDRLVEIVAKIRQMFQRDRQSFDRIDPNQSIELALQGLAPELRAAEIEIQTELQKDLWLWGEATQLQMLFVNLLRNAKEALNTVSGRRRVTVRSELREGFVVFSILDNGPGVPDGRKATLFDLYHSSKESGLGVGLWICRMVAEHHRGSLHYSDAPHRGAQFTVTLPVLEAP